MEKTFAIYINPSSSSAIEEAIFVKEKFSIFAAIFLYFWTGYHRLWGATIFLLLANVMIIIITNKYALPEMSNFALKIGLALYTGFTAHDWLSQKLKKKGYVLHEVVIAGTITEAKHRYYNEYSKTKYHTNKDRSFIHTKPDVIPS